MAFYILIKKVGENDLAVDYCFQSDGERVGIFQIDKKSGEVSLIEQMPGDEMGHIFNRAAIKIIKEWKQGNLPALAEWAS